jgi:hypothetical protein
MRKRNRGRIFNLGPMSMDSLSGLLEAMDNAGSFVFGGLSPGLLFSKRGVAKMDANLCIVD